MQQKMRKIALGGIVLLKEMEKTRGKFVKDNSGLKKCYGMASK